MSTAGSGERMVGGYRLEGRLRETPHLEVFASTDNFGRRVEVFCFDGSSIQGRLSKDEFFEEVRRTAAVAHESSCLLLEMGAEEDLWFVVFLAPEAPSLRDLIDRGGGLAEERVRVAAEGAADALLTIQAAGLRHGDLRPKSVFLTRGQVFLGPRRLVPGTLTESDPAYLAPEELRGEPGDLRSDLFVLGLILREALSGEPAVTACSSAEALAVHEEGRLPALPDDTSSELKGLLAALAALDPDDRPSDPAVVRRVLAGEISLSLPPSSPAPREAGFEVPDSMDSVGAAEAALARAATPLPPPRSPARRLRARLQLGTAKGEGSWDLEDEPLWIGLDDGGYPALGPQKTGESLLLLERRAEGYVAEALEGREPHLRVNGSLVDLHVLADGDRLQLGDATIRFEQIDAAPKTTAAPRPRGRGRGDILLAGATVLLCLVVIAQAAVRWGGIAGRGQGEIEKADEIARRAAELEQAGPANLDSTGGGETQPPAMEDPRDRRRAAQKELEAAAEYRVLTDDVQARIEEGTLYEAYVLFRNFADDHPGTRYADRAGAAAEAMKEHIRVRHEHDMALREEAMEARDYVAALQILDRVELYGSPRMRSEARELRFDLQRRLQETQIPDSGEAPPPPGSTPPEPAAPDAGAPSPPEPDFPEGDLEEKAERVFASGSKAFLRQHWQEAVRHLERLLAPPLRDSRVFAENEAEIQRMLGLARLERDGFAALFHGEVKMGPGRKVAITYRFQTAAEEEDWTFFSPFADPMPGRFEHVGETMRGRGVGVLAHSGVFEPGTLEMEARIQAIKPQDLGLIFLEPKDLVRFYLFSVQNRFFTIGARREPLHENVVWIFGGGAWADTPDAEIGFVRVARSPTPEVTAGEWIDLKGVKDGGKVSLSIKRAPAIQGSSLGDDKYTFPALRPGIYMLRSELAVDEVVIRGVLDEGWALGAMKKARQRYE